MSFIKFPRHIKPARVSVQLLRVQEINASPLTNIQQVAARGNAAWQWRYEFADLSDSERDVVQAFLFKCKGSVNTFRAIDPGDYGPGSGVPWTDVFSGAGDFRSDDGEAISKINSYMGHAGTYDHNISEDKTLTMRRYPATIGGGPLCTPILNGVNLSKVDSFYEGKIYVQRLSFFPPSSGTPVYASIGSYAGSVTGWGRYPASGISSASKMTQTFMAVQSDMGCYIYNETGAFESVQPIELSDYSLVRCGLVVNSQNLFTRSNDFGHADWTNVNVNVVSGSVSGASPRGISNGAWRMFDDTSVNTHHYIEQSITKVGSYGIYTLTAFGVGNVTPTGRTDVQLKMFDSDGDVSAFFHLVAGGISGVAVTGGVYQKQIAAVYSLSNGWWRCQLTASIGNETNVTGRISLISNSEDIAYTGNGSDGINLFGASLVEFPVAGTYVPTVANTVTLTGTERPSGSAMYIAGLDPLSLIKAGQRFEIINRFTNIESSYLERSEFKRITKDVLVDREGVVKIEFEPSLRNTPEPLSITGSGQKTQMVHNPVIFYKPELTARLLAGTVQYTDKPLKTTDISFDVIEDLTE